MTKQEFFNRFVETCGGVIKWTKWSNYYQRELPSDEPTVYNPTNKDISIDIHPNHIDGWYEEYYAEAYVRSKDLWLVLTFDVPANTFTLQENLNDDEGSIIYHVDQAKTLAKCLRKLKQLVG